MSKVDNYIEFIQKKDNKLNEVFPNLMTTPYIIKTARFTYNKLFSKSEKACGNLPDSDKALCIKKFKVRSFIAQQSKLSSLLTNCGQTANPSECRGEVQAKIKTLQFKINILKQAIKGVESK